MALLPRLAFLLLGLWAGKTAVTALADMSWVDVDVALEEVVLLLVFKWDLVSTLEFSLVSLLEWFFGAWGIPLFVVISKLLLPDWSGDLFLFLDFFFFCCFTSSVLMADSFRSIGSSLTQNDTTVVTSAAAAGTLSDDRVFVWAFAPAHGPDGWPKTLQQYGPVDEVDETELDLVSEFGVPESTFVQSLLQREKSCKLLFLVKLLGILSFALDWVQSTGKATLLTRLAFPLSAVGLPAEAGDTFFTGEWVGVFSRGRLFSASSESPGFRILRSLGGHFCFFGVFRWVLQLSDP
jgi:hypothetical protein